MRTRQVWTRGSRHVMIHPALYVYSLSTRHVCLFVSTTGCKPEQQMMYAGSLKSLVDDAGFTKVHSAGIFYSASTWYKYEEIYGCIKI